MLECSRYIHLNPNRSRMTRPAERYRWSSCRNYIGAGPACVPWVAMEKTMEAFNGDRGLYREWIESGKGEKAISPFERAAAGLVLGSQALVDRVKGILAGRPITSGEPSLRCLGSACDWPLPELIENQTEFRNTPAAEQLRRLDSRPEGLASDEARGRLAQFGSNLLKPKKRLDSLALFISQFKSPIILTLFILLKAGDVIRGDCLLLDSKSLFVDETALTGETFPVEKTVAVLAEGTPLGQRTNALWMGMHVVSRSGKTVAVRTGKDTEFGKVSERLSLRQQETEFDHGIRRFGYFLMEMTLVLVIAIFAINVYLKKPALDSFLSHSC